MPESKGGLEYNHLFKNSDMTLHNHLCKSERNGYEYSKRQDKRKPVRFLSLWIRKIYILRLQEFLKSDSILVTTEG